MPRLTDFARAGGYACHMYLNVPTLAADNRRLVFISTRSQAAAQPPFGQNLFTCDLETGRILQVTDLPEAQMHMGWFDTRSGWHYFWRQDGRLSHANVDTSQIEDLQQEPGTVHGQNPDRALSGGTKGCSDVYLLTLPDCLM